jgi:hypothetical protein
MFRRKRIRTKSFAPRFRKRAPAKYLDRLAITVMWTVRPYIESAVSISEAIQADVVTHLIDQYIHE